MSFKTMLLPVEPNESMPHTLATALQFARRFDSHIEGFALRPAAFEFYAFEIVGSMPVANVAEDQQFAADARKQFDAFMAANGVPTVATAPRAPSATGVTAQWVQDPPEDVTIVGSHARAFDITVLGRPGNSITSPRMSTLENCLFESGRPVLIAPPNPIATIGEQVLIAWNGSTEQARTIAFAMPMMARAAKVTVLTVEGGIVPGPTGAKLAANLALAGIACEAVTIAPGDKSTGEAILAYAARQQCDIIVKGAYTQSRLRQMIFGGTTRHLLTAATLPVFMAH